jgi:hypothetical protein
MERRRTRADGTGEGTELKFRPPEVRNSGHSVRRFEDERGRN